MKKATRTLGFTLVELLVVITIIGILSAVLFVNFSKSTEFSRDAQRKADLKELQSAVELYKNENGRYPVGCNGPDVWSGQKGTNYACGDGSSQYINGLAPGYIRKLPTDPRLNGNESGYVYVTNADGSVYKLMAKNTVESEIVDYNNPFKSCDATNLAWVSCVNTVVPPANTSDAAADHCDAGVCDRVYIAPYSNNKPGHCQEFNSQFKSSYGLWGGTANLTIPPSNSNYEKFLERYTENIICAIP